ncbi:MAG: acetolactate synthase small subunit [Chloroflexi bacterium]|nr:acetolactate synthase small subunit [Chloroflexota bacterium]
MQDTLHHTIVTTVRDQPGVLNRVASVIRRRNFNITSLSVGPSEQAGVSRMAFVVEGDSAIAEQVTKQLRKLVDVLKVSDITEENIVMRELAIIKVRTTPYNRSEIIQLVDIFRANIVDVAPESLIIEVTGDQDKVESLIRLLRSFGVREVMRSGRLAMTRGVFASTGEEGAKRSETG